MIVKKGSTKTNLNLKQTENTGLVQWIVLTVWSSQSYTAPWDLTNYSVI